MANEIIRINLGSVNCYLAKLEGEFILFDTGGHTFFDKEFTNRCKRLEEELEKAGCTPGNLKLVLLTHGDNDHVANAAYIRDKYKTKIAMHRSDLELVFNPNVEKALGNSKYKSMIYRIIYILTKRLIKKNMLKTLNDFESFTPDIYIDDNYSLEQYGLKAKVIHIPGHTLGSVGVLIENGDFIAGDTFSNITKPDIAPNAYDFKMLYESVNKIKSMNIKTIYPGHGVPFEFAKIKNRSHKKF